MTGQRQLELELRRARDRPTIAAIEALRNRQVKNFFAMGMLSAGTPMLLMGDEVRRTQQGNNNCYCQDSDISWFDWNLLNDHSDILDSCKRSTRFASGEMSWRKDARSASINC